MKNNNNLEQILSDAMHKIFNTPYNYSIILMSLILWVVSFFFPYHSNQNFDMPKFVIQNIIIFGMLCTVSGVFINKLKANYLAPIGSATVILAIFSLVGIRLIGSILHIISTLIFVPLSIFCFLLLIKNILLIAGDREENKDNNEEINEKI